MIIIESRIGIVNLLCIWNNPMNQQTCEKGERTKSSSKKKNTKLKKKNRHRTHYISLNIKKKIP